MSADGGEFPNPPSFLEENTSELHAHQVPAMNLGESATKQENDILKEYNKLLATIETLRQAAVEYRDEGDMSMFHLYYGFLQDFKKDLAKFLQKEGVKEVVNTQTYATGKLEPTVNAPSSILKTRRQRKNRRHKGRRTRRG
jgi:hypothetical protein